MTHRPPLTQGEIEDRILGMTDSLESATEQFADDAEKAAETEADYRYEYARAMLAFAAEPTLRNAQQREARVIVHCKDKLRERLIAEARRNATRESLLSHRTTIDALRTLSANVRAQT